MASPTTPADVIAFWREAGPDAWFTKDAAFDARFRDAFLDDHFAAARRDLDRWTESADGMLALMILLDQFPRNCFRGTGHMYATDPLALSFARRADTRGDDGRIDPALRVFLYLPYSHSEVLADQERAVALNRRIGAPYLDHAVGHLDVVARFGRFPHRNALMGRETAEEERAFLAEGGFAG
ncbi:DUF924 family protein [Phreatobacter cathodiphilus]|uniref:DUF924 domain-containing protein n=1 Tax=Phreatobacter cathodiphilus TaxID=1868589 RepID=A0A2S0N9B9_9HYPH|nr:DUF924 family protein [Phreatobacter cathodiphilus]AVO44738.1 DUF924 domain-containing protein [Phreatobacter cathodiphilus]